MRTFSARAHSRLDVSALRRGSAVYLERERQITRGEPNYVRSRLYPHCASAQAECLSASFGTGGVPQRELESVGGSLVLQRQEKYTQRGTCTFSFKAKEKATKKNAYW